MFQRYTGREHDINVPVFLSEKAIGYRNRAMSYLMLNFGMVSNNIDETLDLYFQQCSILVNAKDLSMMATSLANGGVNPVTKERAIDERCVQDVISVTLTIEIDHKKREKEVATLTGSAYFQEVQQEVAEINLDEFWS